MANKVIALLCLAVALSRFPKAMSVGTHVTSLGNKIYKLLSWQRNAIQARYIKEFKSLGIHDEHQRISV